MCRAARLRNCQRAIKHCQTYDLCFGYVRSVPFSFGREEKTPGRISDSGFLPLAGEHVRLLIGQWMSVGGNGRASMKFPKDRHSAGRFVLVQDQQLHAGIGSRLPLFVLRQSGVLKHISQLNRRGQDCNNECAAHHDQEDEGDATSQAVSSYGTTSSEPQKISSRLNPLLVRIDKINEGFDIVTVGKSGLLFSHFQPRLHFLVIGY